jgi:hypothetical protein
VKKERDYELIVWELNKYKDEVYWFCTFGLGSLRHHPSFKGLMIVKSEFREANVA